MRSKTTLTNSIFASLFFRQWMSGDPHYADINAFVGEGEEPILNSSSSTKTGASAGILARLRKQTFF